jgi:hypothetical protein
VSRAALLTLHRKDLGADWRISFCSLDFIGNGDVLES